MKLDSIESIIEDIRLGKMVILMDDEDRENEGDLVMAAAHVSPEAINFMAKEGRGLICLPMTSERCDHLGLPMMASRNGTQYSTAFTVSIEAATGVTTGISAADRAHTIKVAVDPATKAQDIVQPGHVFPLRAQSGGVLARAGHTEAGVDLARLAGLMPAAVIVEIMNDDGTMARRPDLEQFAQKHGLKMGTIADLIQYRMNHEQTIKLLHSCAVQTPVGELRLHHYQDTIAGGTHLALVKGQPNKEQPCTVRVHVGQVLRDMLGLSMPEQTGWPLAQALQQIAEAEAGVLLLLDANLPMPVEQELSLLEGQQGKWHPTMGTYNHVGTGAQMLRDLGVGKMRLLSAQLKFAGISGFGLEVIEYVPFVGQE